MNARAPFLASLLFVAAASIGASVATRAAAPGFATREQVEQVLARDLASGSSATTVARFLDAQGIAHGKPVAAGPTVQLTGSVANLRSGTSPGRITLQVHFSFLQDRLIGYSFTEGAAAPASH